MDTVEAILNSQLFWGFIALILAAFALSGKLSVSAAKACLILAWLVAIVGISRLAYLQRLSWEPYVLGLMLIASLIGLGMYPLYQWVEVDQHIQSSASYSVGVRSAMVYDGPGDLSLYMVGYRSMFGDTASPVFYLAHISITNRQNVATTVEGYSAAVSDKEDGPWKDLMPISLLSTKLYVLGIRNPGTGQIAIPRGAYRLATAMTRQDMAHAALLDASPKLEAELRTPIQPSQTVGGWAAFDLKDHDIRGVRNYIRIAVRDSAGKSFSGVIALPRRQPGDSEIDTQVGVITKIGPIVNISSFHVRYYSDPYPSPNKRPRPT